MIRSDCLSSFGPEPAKRAASRCDQSDKRPAPPNRPTESLWSLMSHPAYSVSVFCPLSLLSLKCIESEEQPEKGIGDKRPWCRQDVPDSGLGGGESSVAYVAGQRGHVEDRGSKESELFTVRPKRQKRLKWRQRSISVSSRSNGRFVPFGAPCRRTGEWVR